MNYPSDLGQTWQQNKNKVYKTVNGESMRNESPGVSGSYAWMMSGGLNPKGPMRRNVQENLRHLNNTEWGQ